MVVRRVDVRDRAILEPGVILEAGAHVAKGAIVPSGTVVAMSETFEAHREPVKAPF
jgi:tetrahydrodipicolinate N-succinyltransferase